ncbi:MAG: hypothetical protein HY000_12845 [Planctomycetes bacterium]|nr:hypothetical protein [Planctomycetota bacterium]
MSLFNNLFRRLLDTRLQSAKSARNAAHRGLRRRLGIQPLEARQMLSVEPHGPEFLVNSYSTGVQTGVAIAADSVGNFVAVWSSDGQDGNGYGIYAQRYNSAGVEQGSEFQVNTTTTLDQRNPSVAMDNTGNFVIAWQSEDQDDSSYGVYAQRYNSSGTAQGSEFLVNDYTTGWQANPTVAMDSDGDFLIAWESYGDGSGLRIMAQLFEADGDEVGDEFRANTTTTGNQQRPSAAMDGSGDFVIAWESYGQDAANTYGIYAQRYNSSGTAQGSEFLVNSYTTSAQTDPSVGMDDSGNFVVAWESSGQDGSNLGVYAQRYNSSGTAQGSEFLVNTQTTNSQASPSVAVDSDGDFVIAWESYGQDAANTWGVYAQRYNASGTAQGSEFLVNTYTTNSQFGAAVASEDNGDFVVAWDSNAQDSNTNGIFAQGFGASPPPGDEFRVNTYTTDAQRAPSVARDADGDFVVAWESSGQDGSGQGVFAQRYNASGTAQGSEFQVNTSWSFEQYEASVAMDADGDFVIAWHGHGNADGSYLGIYAQRYNASGVAQGSEFLVRLFPLSALINV